MLEGEVLNTATLLAGTSLYFTVIKGKCGRVEVVETLMHRRGQSRLSFGSGGQLSLAPSATCRRQEDLVVVYAVAPAACHLLLWGEGSGPRPQFHHVEE